MSTITMPMCMTCVHYDKSKKFPACRAFENGIPMKIWLGDVKHIEAYDGDNGIQYKSKDATKSIREVRYKELNKSMHKEQRLVRRKTGKTHLQMYNVADAQVKDNKSIHAHVDFDKVKELYNEVDSNGVHLHALVQKAINNTLKTDNESGVLIFKRGNKTEYETLAGNSQYIELSEKHIEDFFEHQKSWLFHTHPALKSSGEGLSVNDIISFIANRNARCDALSVKYGKVYRVERPSDDYAPPLMRDVLGKIELYDSELYARIKENVFGNFDDNDIDDMMYATGQYQGLYFQAVANIYKVFVKVTVLESANIEFAGQTINQRTLDEYSCALWVRESLKFSHFIADLLNLKVQVFDVNKKKSRNNV